MTTEAVLQGKITLYVQTTPQTPDSRLCHSIILWAPDYTEEQKRYLLAIERGTLIAVVFNRTNNTRGELWWNEVSSNPSLNGSILSIEILRTPTRDPLPNRNPYLNSSTPTDNTALMEISHRRLVSYNAITDALQARIDASHAGTNHLSPISFNDYRNIGDLAAGRGQRATNKIFTDENSAISLSGNQPRANRANSDFYIFDRGGPGSPPNPPAETRPHTNWLGWITSTGVTSVQGPQGTVNTANNAPAFATTEKLQILVGTTEIPGVLVILNDGRVALYTTYNGAGDLELRVGGSEVFRLKNAESDPDILIDGSAATTTVTEWRGNNTINSAFAALRLDIEGATVMGIALSSSNDSVVIQLTRTIARGQRFALTDFQTTGVNGWNDGFIPLHGTERVGTTLANSANAFTTPIRILGRKGETEVHGALVRESLTNLTLISDTDLGQLSLFQGTGGSAALVGSPLDAIQGADYYIDEAVVNAFRYVWTVPDLSLNPNSTNYAIVPTAPNTDMVSLSKVRLLPSDETITPRDWMLFQKETSAEAAASKQHIVRAVPYSVVRDKILEGASTGGGGDIEIDWDNITEESIYGGPENRSPLEAPSGGGNRVTANLISGKSFNNYDAYRLRIGSSIPARPGNAPYPSRSGFYWRTQLFNDGDFVVRVQWIDRIFLFNRVSETSFSVFRGQAPATDHLLFEVTGINIKYKNRAGT